MLYYITPGYTILYNTIHRPALEAARLGPAAARPDRGFGVWEPSKLQGVCEAPLARGLVGSAPWVAFKKKTLDAKIPYLVWVPYIRGPPCVSARSHPRSVF